MKTLILSAIRYSLMFLVPTVTYAISTQWDLDPISGDWNTAANWTPNGVPNGPADTATFGLSNTTDVSISAKFPEMTDGLPFGSAEVNGIVFTSAATNAYTITANQRLLLISGVGIVNNSGIVQSFVTEGPGAGGGQAGEVRFESGASIGTSTTFTNNGGVTDFHNSTAANGTFINNGALVTGRTFPGFTDLSNNSTAGEGTFINNGGLVSGRSGFTELEQDSTAANGTFINNGGLVSGAGGGQTSFFSSIAANGTFINNGGLVSGAGGGQTSLNFGSAANGTFINNGGLVSGAGGGQTSLNDGSTAANGTFINNGGLVSGAGGGQTSLNFGSTAANGTFINNGGLAPDAGGGKTEFSRRSTADSATLIANGGTGGGQGGAIFFEGLSTGGTSRIEVFGNGSLDISSHARPNVGVTVGSIEGDGNVFLGANNLGVGTNNLSTTFSGLIQDGGSGGSLTKVGLGTLILSGANTYTGDTRINSGVLTVDGSINSNTLVNNTGTLAGTGTVHGNVTNRGTVNPGDPVGALTVNNYTQMQYAHLMIQIAGANFGQFGVLDVLGTANLNSGHLDPVLLNGFVPTVGESLTFLNYGSVTGTLFIHDRNIDNLPEHWEVSYFPTYAILSVAAGNVAVPDKGSTFLLFTLGLLGLVMYRRQLLRGQS